MATAAARERPALAHPGAWMYALSGAAWIALLADHSGHGAHAGSWRAAAVSWTVMVVAMMSPLAAPGAAWAARSGLRRLRRRAPVWYLAGFVAMWGAFALAAATAGVALGDAAESPLAVGVAAAVAAVWQSMRLRHRAVDGCGRRVPIPAGGWRCAAATAHAGARHGLWCLAACWAAMLIMIPLHHPVAMAGLFALQLHERRRGPNPFAVRRWQTGAIVYAVIAIAAVAAAAA